MKREKQGGEREGRVWWIYSILCACLERETRLKKMRIRKNAKISPLLFCADASAQATAAAHVCELNQSPWDVIPFHSPPPPLLDSFHHHQHGNYYYQAAAEEAAEEVKEEEEEEAGYDNVTANGSLGDSCGARESVASMKLSGDGEEQQKKTIPISSSNTASVETEDKMRIDEDEDEDEVEDEDETERGFVQCKKGDGKKWQCRNEAKLGQALCEHHIAQLKSYANANYQSSISRKSDKEVVAEADTFLRRHRGSKPKKPLPAASSNPYEFYYYSGFGPRWGKRRGGERESSNATTSADTIISSSTAEIGGESSEGKKELDNDNNNDFSDYDDDDDNDDEDDNVGRRKRTRKPVKARSLKSLM